MNTDTAVRYSTSNVGKSESAQSFPWEDPVPVNKFWDSINYCVSRNFICNFSDEEFKSLPLDPNSSAQNTVKIGELLRLLQDKLEKEEAACAPEKLRDTNYAVWNRLWQAIYTMQSELNLPDATNTVRMLVEQRQTKSNMVPLHMLADHLVKIGEYEEAEETEKPVCAWMDAHERLGKDSPQAINARRIIAKALWMQGPSRRSEAETLIAEINSIVDAMGAGKFAVYQEEERELNRRMINKLRG